MSYFVIIVRSIIIQSLCCRLQNDRWSITKSWNVRFCDVQYCYWRLAAANKWVFNFRLNGIVSVSVAALSSVGSWQIYDKLNLVKLNSTIHQKQKDCVVVIWNIQVNERLRKLWIWEVVWIIWIWVRGHSIKKSAWL